jgi:hypothetical protein
MVIPRDSLLDDIVVDVRYGILYVLRKDILDLREDWVSRPIMERFQGYTHQNAIRLNRLAVAHDDCLVYDFHLVDPDVAIQQIVDDISDVLRECLPWPHAHAVEHPWREIRIVTLDAPASAEQEITAYIEAVRRSKSENDG